jgi:hypothetical protein
MNKRSGMRRLLATAAALVASVAIASTTLAHECINASKADQSTGAQIILGPEGEVLYLSSGLARRIEQGLVDVASGDGFHGLVGFDVDVDGSVDVATWIDVGPDGEIPLTAQLRGPACRGLTNIGLYLEQCAAG